MKSRISVLFVIGVFLAGSTVLGYYYYYVYRPPLRAAEEFMKAVEAKDAAALRSLIVVNVGLETGDLRPATDKEVQKLLAEKFAAGRVLDQRKREGESRTYYYLVYREPDGTVFALVTTEFDGRFRIVIPEAPMSKRHRYLWDYTWTN